MKKPSVFYRRNISDCTSLQVKINVMKYSLIKFNQNALSLSIKIQQDYFDVSGRYGDILYYEKIGNMCNGEVVKEEYVD